MAFNWRSGHRLPTHFHGGVGRLCDEPIEVFRLMSVAPPPWPILCFKKGENRLFPTRHYAVGLICYDFIMKKIKALKPPSSLPNLYTQTLADLKRRVHQARLKTVLSVNNELILLYWDIGRLILVRQSTEGWGGKVVERLAHDLSAEFPDMRGFSPRNLLFMRSFAEAFTSGPIVKQLVSQLPWGHIIRLLQKVKSPADRNWYIKQTIENGWSRNMLEIHLASGLAKRKGKAITNFHRRLPAPQSELAEQTFKDPYIFDFLSMDLKMREREVEKGLVEHITKFLLELGSGFAFVGRQVRLEVGGDDFYMDLLFYHLRLRSYVVVEIKNSRFKPEYAGQLNFYLAAVDDKLRREHDNPSIGLVLCREKNRLVAEYSLRNIKTPIGVAEFKLVKDVPRELRPSLPTIAELEAELSSK